MARVSQQKDYFYVTTPIYYVNDVPHIGHAYSSLAADVIARFKRLDGFEVKFLTGTDEHGQKVEKAAQKAGLNPQDFTDQVSENFRTLNSLMNYSNDDFIRTTEDRHKQACYALWDRLKERGEIYLGSYSGWYAVRDEAFYGEDELVKNEQGQMIAPSGAQCEWVEEPSYFFRLSAWQDKLLEFYDANADSIAPSTRRNEVISFVKSGLRDLSISRTTFDWGIPVPGDSDHVMYVWIDALTNYISALGFPDEKAPHYQNFWPADIHVIGKDILRFHAVYWPAFLLAAGITPPKKVFAHGWLLNKGQKMSKSLGNVLRPADLVARYGLDPLRYYLLREVSFGSDGYISHESMVQRINGDLANDLGNLGQRVLSIVAKSCGGKTPEPVDLSEGDHTILQESLKILSRVRGNIDELAYHKALEEIWSLVSLANRYVDDQAPWALRKTDTDRFHTVLYVLMDIIRRIALMLLAFMPESMEKLLNQLGVDENARTLGSFEQPVKVGTVLIQPQAVFPRFTEEKV